MITRRSRIRGRARLAVLLLGAALALPGVGIADHLECDGTMANPCPDMNVNLEAGIQVPFTNAVSGITYRFTQSDHASPVINATYFVPKGWQFAVDNLRQARQANGVTPATNCDQIYPGFDNHADNTGHRIGNAENLAGGVGMTGRVDMLDDRYTIQYGYRLRGPASSTTDKQFPSLGFLDWNPGTGTARFCMYLYNADFLVDHTDDTSYQNPVTAINVDDHFESSRQFIVPITMQKLVGNPDFDWSINFNIGQVYWDQWLNDRSPASDCDPFICEVRHNVSITQVLFYFESLSGGNWHRNPLTGALERLAFSRTPVTPGRYELRGVFDGCLNGLNPVPGPGAAPHWHNFPSPLSTICNGGTFVTKTLSKFVDITPPPNHLLHEWGRLTGVGNATGAVQAGLPTGFSLVRNSTSAQFKWNQAPTNPVPIKGYELQISRPGDQVNRRVEYLVTNPSFGGFDPSVCGALGTDTACLRNVSFPAATMGSRSLTGDEKYDVSVVTIYTDGTRSDRKCDNGAPLGAACSPASPAIRIADATAAERARGDEAGISKWQVYVTSRNLPVAYLMNSSVTRTGSSTGGYTAPRYLSITNFPTKESRFIVWNPLGLEVVRTAPSLLIVGDNASGGLISMADPSIAGKVVRWRADLLGGPPGTAARGLYLTYDAKGLPELPPSGLPTAFTEIFQGTRLA